MTTAIPAQTGEHQIPGTAAGDLREAEAFLKGREHQPESIVMRIPVTGSTQEEKLADLERIAVDLGVHIGVNGGGTRIAEKRFGRVRIIACVDPDSTRRIAGTRESWQEIERERAAITAARQAAAA